MESVFGILVSRLRVLLSTMEQKPNVVGDIAFTCIVGTQVANSLTYSSPLPSPLSSYLFLCSEKMLLLDSVCFFLLGFLKHSAE